MKSKTILLKVGKISGMYYSCGIKTDTILIYGIGAPNVPDNGILPEAQVVIKNKIDLFVPDYIGFGRSGGYFTPKNCIKTFLALNELFQAGVMGLNHYSHVNLPLKYKRIIFVGRSLGGTYVPLLARYSKNIKDIGIIFGALDQSRQGEVEGEETNEDFVNSILLDGYRYLYKGFNKQVWWRHLNDKDGLSPMDNIRYLKNTKVFVAHGKKDKCIHYSKSVKFYNALTKMFPDKCNSFKLKLYEKGGHDKTVACKAIKDYLKWLGFNDG